MKSKGRVARTVKVVKMMPEGLGGSCGSRGWERQGNEVVGGGEKGMGMDRLRTG
jgi:hypothetical protein